MPNFRGRDFLLKVSDGTSPTTFQTVAGLRASSLSINNNPVDVTNVGSGGFRTLMPDAGVQQFSMSGNGIFDNSVVGDQLLKSAAIGRTTIQAMIISGSGEKFIGNFVVSQYQRNGNYDGAEEFSVSLEGSGQIIFQSS